MPGAKAREEVRDGGRLGAGGLYPQWQGPGIFCRCSGSRVEVAFSRDKVPSDLGSQKAALASPWMWTVEGRVAWKGLVRQLSWSSRGS